MTDEARAPSADQRRAFVATLRADQERTGARVAALAAKARQQVGMGPTWREVGRVMGWDEPWQWQLAMRRLERWGWIVTTPEARSLRPGPKATNNHRPTK